MTIDVDDPVGMQSHGAGEVASLQGQAQVALRVRVQAASWLPVVRLQIYEQDQLVFEQGLDPLESQPLRFDQVIHLPLSGRRFPATDLCTAAQKAVHSRVIPNNYITINNDYHFHLLPGWPCLIIVFEDFGMFVCLCKVVTGRQIERAIHEGAETVSDVGASCGAGTGCGACQEQIGEILDRCGGGGCSRAGDCSRSLARVA